MTTHDERVALWHRLRDDPDFEPDWLRFMGSKPPVEDAGHRTWGDGGGDARKHVIVAISFRAENLWVTCRCGWLAQAVDARRLEDMWDIHRGLDVQRVAERGMERHELATDEDVTAFLMAVEAGATFSAEDGPT